MKHIVEIELSTGEIEALIVRLRELHKNPGFSLFPKEPHPDQLRIVIHHKLSDEQREHLERVGRGEIKLSD